MASEIPHATIIAGGIGSRAHGMTGDRIPKALLPVAGIPIVYRQLEVLAREGVRAVTVLAGHLGDQLKTAMAGEAARLSITIDVVVEKEPLGTAGCLTALGAKTQDARQGTLIVYGDMLFDMDLKRLAAFHARQGAMLTIVAHPNDHPDTSDLLVARDGIVSRILPAKTPRDGDFRNLVPAGLYLAGPAFLNALKPGLKADMIHDVLPALLEKYAGQSSPRARSALAGEGPVAGSRASEGLGDQKRSGGPFLAAQRRQ